MCLAKLEGLFIITSTHIVTKKIQPLSIVLWPLSEIINPQHKHGHSLLHIIFLLHNCNSMSNVEVKHDICMATANSSYYIMQVLWYFQHNVTLD